MKSIVRIDQEKTEELNGQKEKEDVVFDYEANKIPHLQFSPPLITHQELEAVNISADQIHVDFTFRCTLSVQRKVKATFDKSYQLCRD